MAPYSRLNRIMSACPAGLPFALKIREVTPIQGGGKGHPAFPVECQERQQNAAHGAAPQEPLPLGKIRCDGLLHRLPSKKISTPAHLPRPNDVRECYTTRWQFVYVTFTALIIAEAG